jgi:hypothetical protein
MKSALNFAVYLAICTHCTAQEEDVAELLAQSDQAIQEQIARTYDALGIRNFELDRNVEAFRELQKLKEIAPDQEALVKQLAIFAATPGDDEQRPLATYVILMRLEIPPKATIHVLAPYLDVDHPTLRSFAREWFQSHYSADSLEFINNKIYVEYVRRQVRQNEEIPIPFIKYIFERSPGRALMVFRSATADPSGQLKAIRMGFDARQQGRELTDEEREEIRQIKAKSQRDGQKRREILLAEHIISNALWLKKHGFDERFYEALPEAAEELKKLAKRDEWWARLYVVYIMRQNLVLLHDFTLRQLAADENELVRDAAKR